MAIPTRKAFVDALVRAGFIDANELNSTMKIVITLDPSDLNAMGMVIVDVRRIGDERLINAINEFKED